MKRSIYLEVPPERIVVKTYDSYGRVKNGYRVGWQWFSEGNNLPFIEYWEELTE